MEILQLVSDSRKPYECYIEERQFSCFIKSFVYIYIYYLYIIFETCYKNVIRIENGNRFALHSSHISLQLRHRELKDDGDLVVVSAIILLTLYRQ